MDSITRQAERAAATGDFSDTLRMLRVAERGDGFPADGVEIEGVRYIVIDGYEQYPTFDAEHVTTEPVDEDDDEGLEFVLCRDSETAGKLSRDYWRELAEDDPDELAALVGNETLVDWAFGRLAGPGTTKVHNMNEWLDLWLNTPEEHLARYDGEERRVSRVGSNVAEQLGFIPSVAYREN